MEGKLKAEIIQDPERYVSRDPEMAQTLLDQRQAGKALLLITNRWAWGWGWAAAAARLPWHLGGIACHCLVPLKRVAQLVSSRRLHKLTMELVIRLHLLLLPAATTTTPTV